MTLPLVPPIDPMLARSARTLPTGPFAYEPKWDGFRCVVFRDGHELMLQSRNGRPLDRYFPELVDPEGPDPLRGALPDRVVVDGELVVPGAHGLDFDALSARIHPAASRIELLAQRTPARFVVFDLLALDDSDLVPEPYARRRAALESVLGGARSPVHLTPVTQDADRAADWFARFEGAGLDGVIAKSIEDSYAPGQRGFVKVKRERTADVVVAGFRLHKDGAGIGSLMLGLWRAGELVHVGVASSFSAARRRELVEELDGHRVDDTGDHPWGSGQGTAATPRGPNRWSGGRDTSWVPLDCRQVAEVRYTQLTGDRFRHGARFVRWRVDRDPASCRFDQLGLPPPAELSEVLGLADRL